MTTDIKVRWDDGLFEGDFLFEDNDLDTDEGLGTAVLMSWFTDQRASDDDIIPSGDDDFFGKKRGWWGDEIDPVAEGDQIGSKLWLLNRSKTTQENITDGIAKGKAAIQHMIDDGIVKDINVIGERIKYNQDYILALKAEIIKTDGSKVNISFDPEWFATFDEN